eukprot:TRINITY_DN91358_c0_g1_i1.p2 TRINITY_DN91358_c0_g1~~TRINITY_DN91358_c0_g1_i1.p2  ORF type:complete len:147 (-),score=19.20 TRINITY_DN91358_c0_g1_i1:374-814(-)
MAHVRSNMRGEVAAEEGRCRRIGGGGAFLVTLIGAELSGGSLGNDPSAPTERPLIELWRSVLILACIVSPVPLDHDCDSPSFKRAAQSSIGDPQRWRKLGTLWQRRPMCLAFCFSGQVRCTARAEELAKQSVRGTSVANAGRSPDA